MSCNMQINRRTPHKNTPVTAKTSPIEFLIVLAFCILPSEYKKAAAFVRRQPKNSQGDILTVKRQNHNHHYNMHCLPVFPDVKHARFPAYCSLRFSAFSADELLCSEIPR